jgi:hypothetical protein
MPVLGTIDSQKSGHLWTAIPAFYSIATAAPTGTNTVTFSSIPQTFKHLKIIGTAQSTYTAYNSNVNLTFNGDTTNNYYSASNLNAQGGSNPYKDTAAYINLTRGAVTGTYMTSGWSVTEFDIPNYTETDIYKSVQGQWSVAALAYPATYQTIGTGTWKSTAAITSIELVLTSLNFVTGSRFNLFGLY